MKVTVAKTKPYDLDEAASAVIGYALGTEPLRLLKRRGTPAQVVQIPRWSYRGYDCLSTQKGSEFSDLDVFAVEGLNAKMSVRSVATLRNAADRASAYLARADAAARGRKFWDLTRAELGPDPKTGSLGYHLAATFSEVTRTAGVTESRAHRLLHHKRPALFPLIDSFTLPTITSAAKDMRPWAYVHSTVVDQAEAFGRLEDAFAEFIASRTALGVRLVPLTRLRILDILLALNIVVGERTAAVRIGRALRTAPGWPTLAPLK